MSGKPKARVLAYYLPQFHPIPENDKWWGKGFTEWTNVGKAKRFYPGHYQPRVPADLGYYDLRVPETREAQAEMARAHGIEGFVYWHYWFGNGKRLLERPFNEVLASGKPDFPFALAWANETWSGSCHGLVAGKTLIEQLYPGDDDYFRHFQEVLPAFRDKRYILCEGKPIFFIYHPEQFKDVAHFTTYWNKLAVESGLKGIYFVAMRMDVYDVNTMRQWIEQVKRQGFDSVTVANLNKLPKLSLWWRIVRKFFYQKLKLIPNVRPYDEGIFHVPMSSNIDVWPTVFADWDHTPRTGRRGLALHGCTPQKFKEEVSRKLNDIIDKPFDKRFLMVKSWNEWAEGNYLEPDLKWGRGYLQAIKDIVVG